MGKGTLAALGVVLILFAAVWLAVAGLPATDRRGVAIGAFVAGVVSLAVGLV